MSNHIQKAVNLLNAGELVAFPTETVYGLGADASNPEAIRKIFLVKGRPASHPVIVHIGDIQQLSQWAKEIPNSAYALAHAYWPGPMTLILTANNTVSPLITAGQNTIGIRMPAHPLARELLQIFGRGIAAPSANRFGYVSPTTAKHVEEELGDKISLILDGGSCTLGLESTIINLTYEKPAIVRLGPLTEKQVSDILGKHITFDASALLRVPGNLPSHYAPSTPLLLLPTEELNKVCAEDTRNTLAVMAFGACDKERKNLLWRQMPYEPHQYAKILYSTLRELDKKKVAYILVESVPLHPDWSAIKDRLQRAAHRN